MQPCTERRTGALSHNKGKHYSFVCWQSPRVNDNGRQSDCGDLLCDLVETKETKKKKKRKLVAMIGCPLDCHLPVLPSVAQVCQWPQCSPVPTHRSWQRAQTKWRQRQVPICCAALLGLASSREWVAVGALHVGFPPSRPRVVHPCPPAGVVDGH